MGSVFIPHVSRRRVEQILGGGTTAVRCDGELRQAAGVSPRDPAADDHVALVADKFHKIASQQGTVDVKGLAGLNDDRVCRNREVGERREVKGGTCTDLDQVGDHRQCWCPHEATSHQ